MNTNLSLPKIRQGGMGVRISGYRLAKAVSMLGQAGTLSGAVLERVMARLLQLGDISGDIRRALSNFPIPQVADRIIKTYFRENGAHESRPFKGVSMYSIRPSRLLVELTICANFAFVWLAKEGHGNPITINYLEKIGMPHLYAVTGAMLAGVDAITVGAGVALQFPAMIDNIFNNREASYRVPVTGNNIKSHLMRFNPVEFFGKKLSFFKKPLFIPIIASNLLASIFIQKLPPGSVDAFVVEEWLAGGHNAPPRKAVLDEKGQGLPIYGDKDIVDYKKIASLGLPFWIGGAKATPESLNIALDYGAAGIQAGSIFALCNESDMDENIKTTARGLGFEENLLVRTDMRVSPTEFPFKVAEIIGTTSERTVYEARTRVCNQGALVSLYETPEGKIGYRCPSEPIDKYIAKGGKVEDTISRACLCNALSAAAGIGNKDEPPILTMGDDLGFLKKVMKNKNSSYSAEDAINYLLSS